MAGASRGRIAAVQRLDGGVQAASVLRRIADAQFTDPTNARTLYFLAGGLVALGLGLAGATVWWWRAARNEDRSLAPLEDDGRAQVAQVAGQQSSAVSRRGASVRARGPAPSSTAQRRRSTCALWCGRPRRPSMTYATTPSCRSGRPPPTRMWTRAPATPKGCRSIHYCRSAKPANSSRSATRLRYRERDG